MLTGAGQRMIPSSPWVALAAAVAKVGSEFGSAVTTLAVIPADFRPAAMKAAKYCDEPLVSAMMAIPPIPRDTRASAAP